jgi:DNA-binding NtrC family response regulator
MKTLRVLIAEDHELIGVMLAEFLEEAGHQVCAIESTEAGAVMAAAHYLPDLVIADLRLGGGSGIAAVERMLRVRNVAYLFIGGNISAVEAFRAEAVALQKPFNTDQLSEAIERALNVAVRVSLDRSKRGGGANFVKPDIALAGSLA